MSNTELDPNVIEEITVALATGQKIEAIRIYRTATNQGLKESKQFIDQLIPGLIEKDPERFANLAAGSGCGSAVLIMISLACIVAVWVLF